MLSAPPGVFQFRDLLTDVLETNNNKDKILEECIKLDLDLYGHRYSLDKRKLFLNIGAGTFMPLRAKQLQMKKLHKEYFSIEQKLCNQIKHTKKLGGRIIAVGTTATRALETVGLKRIEPKKGYTDIFIYPGFRFKVVDAMITNFHLPESSLMMLVAAFCGRKEILSAYRYAVENRYRFFSYGDAMFLERKDT